jgi:N-acetylglucosaminylphosphatidylinositol deacetylase
VALLRDFSWVRLNYISAWQAMKFHSSQFNWYRKLWVVFSRYTYVNTYCLRRVRLP